MVTHMRTDMSQDSRTTSVERESPRHEMAKASGAW